MLLKTNEISDDVVFECEDGIRCDSCAAPNRGDFVYYSVDARDGKATDNHFQPGLDRKLVTFSFDLCSACMDKIGTLVRDNYKPTSVGLNCDFCCRHMVGDFQFYYITISKVAVALSSAPIRCVTCDAVVVDFTAGCKCGGTKRCRRAELKVDDKFLQIVVCPTDFDQLKDTVVKTRAMASELAAKEVGSG